MGDPTEEFESAMRRAVALAATGLGATSPNPSVGAVILSADGMTVGEGHTSPAGGPHAEIVALAQAGERARGGTAVVTLEPCNHTGRTGPCTDALLAAGIARVVVAIPDPNPVAAGGLAKLAAAGVETHLFPDDAELADSVTAAARHGLRYWLTSIRRERPYLIWKYAATLDGRSAAADGSSKWITSETARADVHRLRSTVDAVIAGVGTVLADDAQLTVRSPDGLTRQPLRVVVDSNGRTPTDARVRDASAPTFIATAATVGSTDSGQVDLRALMAELFHRGVRGALLEGGPTLAGAFLRAGLVDEVVGYIAPKLLGAGPAALGDLGATAIGDALDLRFTSVEWLPADPDRHPAEHGDIKVTALLDCGHDGGHGDLHRGNSYQGKGA